MGSRYEQAYCNESETGFQVVEIVLASKAGGGACRKNCRFLLVHNSRETLDAVQLNMHDFIRNALLAIRIENTADDNKGRVLYG